MRVPAGQPVPIDIDAAPAAAEAADVPVWIPSGPEHLFAILTPPAAQPRGVGVILAATGNDARYTFSVLARRLAASGHHVLRFDFHGMGRSTGPDVMMTIDQPYPEDMVAAAEELRRRGAAQIVVVGKCFGALSTLAAFERIPGLRGIVFVSLPLHRWTRMARGTTPTLPWRGWAGLRDAGRRRAHLRGLYYWLRGWQPRPWAIERPYREDDGKDWTSPVERAQLRRLVDGEIPALFVYGMSDDQFREFRCAQEGATGALLERAGGRVQVRFLEGHVHNNWAFAMHDQLATPIAEWIDRLPRATAPRREGSRGLPATGGGR